MLYFFTEKQKREIRREYLFRFLNIFLGIMSIVLVVGALFLIPTYFLLVLDEDAFQKEADSLSITNLANDRDELRDKINVVNHKIKLLEEDDQEISFLIKELTDRQIRSINMNVIEVTEKDDGTEIKIQGISNNRESLVSFGNILEDSEHFEAVDFPVSSFTRNVDIPFVLTMRVVSKEKEND